MVKLDRLSYPACTLPYNGKQCNKKVDDSGGGDGPDRWCALRAASLRPHLHPPGVPPPAC